MDRRRSEENQLHGRPKLSPFKGPKYDLSNTDTTVTMDRRKSEENRLHGRPKVSSFKGPKHDLSREEDPYFKLYVRNIPSIWTQDELVHLFSRYGHLASVFLSPSTAKFSWAFVEYFEQDSAENAIQYLNETRPYNFLVTYSLTEEEKANRALEKSPQYDSRANVSKHNFSKHEDREASISDDLPNKKLSIQMVIDNKTGARTVNGRLSISSQVMLGPVYPIEPHTEEMRCKVEKALDKLLCEEISQKNGSGDKCEEKYGSCFVCGVVTVNACTKCLLWYCSRNCQIKDWPTHKLQCLPIPDLKSMNNNQSEYKKNPTVVDNHITSKPTSYYKSNDRSRYDQSGRFERKKFGQQNDDFVNNKDENRTPTLNKSFGNDKVRNFDERNANFAANKNRNFADRNKGFEGNQSVTHKREFGRTIKSNEKIQSDLEDENSQFWDSKVKSTKTPSREESKVFKTVHSPGAEHPLLPTGVLKNVTVAHVLEDDHYSVQLNEMMSTLDEMMSNLYKASLDAAPITPTERAKCIVLSDNKCFRALINSVSPLCVTYVDYGNQERVHAHQLKTLPEEFKQHQRMAVKIRLAPGSKKEYYQKKVGDSFSVKAMCKSLDGSIIVEAIDTQIEKTVSPRTYSTKVESPQNLPKVESPSPNKLSKGEASSSLHNDLLPPNVFSEVMITFVEGNGLFWVQTVNNLATSVKMSEDILEEANQGAAFTPVLDAICLAIYSNEWCRGRITSVSPLKVLFIDFGNEESCSISDLRACSPKLQALPPIAVKICFAAGTPEKFLKLTSEKLVKVKPVSQANGVVTVQVEGHSYLPPAEPAPIKTRQDNFKLSQFMKNVTELLKKRYTGLCQVQKEITGDKIVVQVLCSEISDTAMVLDIPEILSKQPLDPSFKACAGDIVGVEHTDAGQWARGLVLRNNRFKLCDSGIEVTPLNVKQLPSSLNNIPYLAVVCELQLPKLSKEFIETKYFKVGTELFFEVLNVNENGCIDVELKTVKKTEVIGHAVFKPWLPYASESVDLKSGDTVIMSAFHSDNEIYVTPVQFFEDCVKLEQLTNDCTGVDNLASDPEIGDLVACNFSQDKLWYRAKIIKKVGDQYEVLFVDYGNKEVSSVSNMKNLPTKYENFPFAVVRIGLANKLNKPFTEPVSKLLTKCNGTENLNVEFQDLNSVVLFRSSGSNLNDEINNLLDPNWNKPQEEPETDLITMDMLPDATLELGCEVTLTLFKLKPDNLLVMYDSQSLELEVEMQKTSDSLQKYVNSLPGKSHVPETSELCAIYSEDDKKWYRAVCLSSYPDKANVLLIDVGDEVCINHSNIRKLVKEFTTSTALVLLCFYEAIAEQSSQQLTEKLKELLKENGNYNVIIQSVAGVYNIDIPSITLILQNEGLV